MMTRLGELKSTAYICLALLSLTVTPYKSFVCVLLTLSNVQKTYGTIQFTTCYAFKKENDLRYDMHFENTLCKYHACCQT